MIIKKFNGPVFMKLLLEKGLDVCLSTKMIAYNL